MDLSLTADQQQLQRRARNFVFKELKPFEDQIENQDDFPRPLFHKLRQKAVAENLYAYNVPQKMGGLGLSTLEACLIKEETGKVSIPLRNVLKGIPGLLLNCNEDQRRRFLDPYVQGNLYTEVAFTEPSSGSDAAHLQTNAQRIGDEYVVNGAKHLIAMADKTDFLMTVVSLNGSESAKATPMLLLIPSDSVGIHMTRQPTMGQWGATPSSISFRDVRVPVTNRLGEEGDGVRIMMRHMAKARLIHGAVYAGMAEYLLTMAVEHARRRVTFGQPLIDRQAIQWMLSDIAVDVYATRSMTYSAAWEADQGQDIRVKASMVKLYASEMAFRTADTVMQIFGGIGYLKALPIERFLREARVGRFGSGTSEVQRMTIARYLGAHYEGDMKPSQLKPSDFQ